MFRRVINNNFLLSKKLIVNILYTRQICSNITMSKSALLILSEGSEEMEAVITADVLRRAGVHVTIAGLQETPSLKCSRDVVIVPDIRLSQTINTEYDAVILPGGLQGAENFSKSDLVKKVLEAQEKSGRLIAAICAAPIALKSHGIGAGKTITSYPGKKSELTTGEYTYSEERVVVDGELITSRGPGTAFEFALAIVEHLLGKEKADSLVGPMLIKI